MVGEISRRKKGALAPGARVGGELGFACMWFDSAGALACARARLAHHISTPRQPGRKKTQPRSACIERRDLSGEAGKARSRNGPGRNRTAVPEWFNDRYPTRVVDDLSRPPDSHRRDSGDPPGTFFSLSHPACLVCPHIPLVNVGPEPPLSR